MRISDWSSDVCSSDLIMRTPMTADDYRASRPIVDPLRLFDCSPVGDGAVCVIVAAAGANARAVRITGAQGMRAGRNEFIFAPSGLGMAQQSHTRRTRDEARSQRVYEMAAARPEDIDVLGLYDSFSPLPLHALEDFGFCEDRKGTRQNSH